MYARRLLIACLLCASCRPDRAPGEAGEQPVSGVTEAAGRLAEDLPLLEVRGRTIGLQEVEIRTQLLSQTAMLRMGEPSRRSELLRSLLQVELMANAATDAGLVGDYEERLLDPLLKADWQLRRVGMEAMGEHDLTDDAVAAAFEGSADAGPELREARIMVLPDLEAAEAARAEMVRLRRETSKQDEEIFIEVCKARTTDAAAAAVDCATGPIARSGPGSTTNRALSDALFALPKSGRVSPIYQTARGWEMVQLIRVIGALDGGLEAARPIVSERALRDGRAAAAARWLASIEAQMPASLDEAALSDLTRARQVLGREPAPAAMVARRYETAGLADGPSGVLTQLELREDESALSVPFANPVASPAAGSGSGGE